MYIHNKMEASLLALLAPNKSAAKIIKDIKVIYTKLGHTDPMRNLDFLMDVDAAEAAMKSYNRKNLKRYWGSAAIVMEAAGYTDVAAEYRIRDNILTINIVWAFIKNGDKVARSVGI